MQVLRLFYNASFAARPRSCAMTIDLAALIEHGGAAAIFLGAAFEGEAAVVTGGWLAARGLVHPLTAALCAFAGSLTADQLLFAFGRRHREHPRVAKLLAKPPARRATALIERYPTLFCLAFRFLYGLRIAGPLTIAASRVPTARFVVLNIVSAACWASIFTFVGYRFGRAIEAAVVAVAMRHPVLIGVVIATIVGTVAWYLFRPEAEA